MGYLDDYLAALPQGEASYPSYQQKASAYRLFLEMMPMEGVAEALPAPVARLITHPEPVSAWLPQVHVFALYLAVLDVHFDDAGVFIDRCGDVDRALLDSRLYRMLMRVASPTVVLRGAKARWGSFHRGVDLHLDRVAHGTVEGRITYPTGLVPEVLTGSYAIALQAALELAGAKDARLEVTGYTPLETRIEGHWR